MFGADNGLVSNLALVMGIGATGVSSSFILVSGLACLLAVPLPTGMTAVVLSCVLVGLALLITGAVVGLLSGASPLKRALRQLAIGLGAGRRHLSAGFGFRDDRPLRHEAWVVLPMYGFLPAGYVLPDIQGELS